VKDTDIHENIEPVDLNHVLDCLVEPYLAPNGNGRVTQQGRALAPYPGKPLALKRCIGNLIDNAMKYGQNAQLHIDDDERALCAACRRRRPGVPEQRLEQVFEPHFRWPGSSRAMGWGWGLRAISPIAMAVR
jgi:signal transduction histidine kinase